jgi:hypothetical protein
MLLVPIDVVEHVFCSAAQAGHGIKQRMQQHIFGGTKPAIEF